MYLIDLFVKMGEKEQCDFVCGAPLDDWATNVDMLISYACIVQAKSKDKICLNAT